MNFFKKNFFSNFLLSISSILVFWSVLEIFFGMTNLHEKILFSNFFQKFENIAIECRIHRKVYLLDDQLFWRIGPAHGDVSKQGFRNPDIFSKTKPEKTFRIICIGDSVPFGVSPDVTKTEQAYPAVLEIILKTKTRKNIEVINAGVPGYSSLQGLRYLKRDLVQFEPDLVIAHFGPNDGATAFFFSDKEQPILPRWLIKTQNFLCRSKTYSFLNAVFFYFKYKKVRTPSFKRRVSEEDYKNNLSAIADLGEQAGFATVFLPSIQYKDAIGIFQVYSLPEDVVQISGYKNRFQKEPVPKSLFWDNCHFTEKGHVLTAEIIAEALLENGYITI